MNLFRKKNLVKIIIAVLTLGIVVFLSIYFPSAQMVTAGDFGIVSFVASLPKDHDKQAMVTKIQKAGFGWVREEYTYTLPMNYVPFDQAYSKILKADLKILGLLTYPGADKSHDVWKNYVTETISRYPEVAAWEIMNEADNYLSAADYTVYLKEASEIIRAKTKARIICTGITARVGNNQFWDGIATAGGWDAFDAVALHIYHFGDPYKDENDNGTFAQVIQKAIESIKQNSGEPSTTLGINKTIWVTEFGYDANEYGTANQAQWLVESLSIMKAMPEVERAFVFRLYEHDNGLGLLNVNFEEKEAFGALESWLAAGAPATTASLTPPPVIVDVAPPEAEVNIIKSIIRLDGENISPDGQEQFRVVVSVKDTNNQIITNQKPVLIVSGEKTIPTDFTLVGDEWFAYVASSEAGEASARVEVAETELGTVQMVFGATDTKAASEIVPETITPAIPPANTPKPIINPPATTTYYPVVTVEETTGHSKSGLLWFIIIETIILILIIIIIFQLWNRSRSIKG